MNRVKLAVLFLAGLFLQIGTVCAQNRTINGIVTMGQNNEPLVGVTIFVKGAETMGVVSDIDGHYTLTVKPDAKEITFRYIGMKEVRMPVPANGTLNVKMIPESTNLDEVVVTGYGNFSKSSFTGSANTLKGDMIKDVPVLSVEQKLQGLTSGVSITSGSGQPGAVPNIRIRGTGSYNASNEPLYVIDGVPVASGSISNLAAYMNNAKTSLMATLNPSDIENITVIKDAAAASLYGSRAANGVILITTKRGKSGGTQITFKADGGFGDIASNFRPSMGGEERRQTLHEGLVNYAADLGYENPQEYADSQIDKYASKPWSGYTDWRDILFRKAKNQNYEISATGGNDKTTYFSSLSYSNQQGTVENSELKRYTARLNLTQKVGKRGNIGGNIMFSQIDQRMNDERTSFSNPFFAVGAMVSPSDFPYNEDGSYSNNFPGYGGGIANPKRDITLDYCKNRLTRIFATGNASVEIAKGLQITERLSYDYSIAKDFQYFNPNSSEYSGRNGVSNKGFNEYGRLISSTSLGYVRDFGKHHLDVLAAYEIESYATDKAEGKTSNLPSELLMEPDNASLINGFSGSTSASRMLSYVTRANYDYANRYYIAGSYRRDGSSHLAPENRWGNFWSVSGMWHVSKENFMAPARSVLSDLKLRASYGVNGNQPGPNGYMGLYSYGKNYGGLPGSYESSIANPYLSWEKNYSLNTGIDFSLFEHIFISLEYYSRQTKDLLFSMPISMTNGFSNYLANIGELNNKGVELEIRSTNFSRSDFDWMTVFNLTHNQNKIITLDGRQQQIVQGEWYIQKVGLPFNSFYVREFAGVNPDNGDALYYINSVDEKGNYNKAITNDIAKANPIPYKKADPIISGGLTNILNYKFLDLSFTFTYSLGGNSIDKTAKYVETDGDAAQYYRNIPVYYQNRWQKPGDVTDIPRFVYNQPNKAGSYASSRRVHSTDHIRLKNLVLGASLPQQWASRLGIEKLRVYFAGTNLLTWSKWDFYDPETPVNGEMNCEAPPLRMYNFGVEVSF